MWGHATTNCYRKPRCVKCAGEHYTNSCSLQRSEAPTCANCKGRHTASNMECPVYKFKIAKLLENQATMPENPVPKYKPAPLPTRNIWEERRKTTAASASAIQPQAATRAEPIPGPSTQRPPASDFDELQNQMSILNSLINIKETIKAIKALNSMLKEAKGPMEIMSVLQAFTENEIHKFNIENKK